VPSTEGALLGACGAFELEKACYELRYERDNRPDWVAIPLAGIRRFLTP
jgi:predicted trehalose synthase